MNPHGNKLIPAAGPIRIVERLEDEPGFEFRRAWIADNDGRPEARADLGGVECVIETKEAILEAGGATCLPLDPEWEANWPLWVRISVDGEEKLLKGATADPRVVAAARQFAARQAAGRAEIGSEL
jgi:hypothetical protein